MQRIRQLQASRNAESRDGWDRFAPHRERVTQLLLQAAPAVAGKLCVLGAGNCNDLALDRLADAFAHIDLVDIDEDALTAGIARQNVATDRITPRGGVDTTGVAELVSAWTPEVPAPDEQVDDCIANAQRTMLPMTAGDYSVTVSSCLLSQLIESLTVTLGDAHPRFLDLLTCIRHEHLRQLIHLTMPGGTVILIADVVSSFTVGELATASHAELPGLIGRAVAQRNFFSGMNPFIIRHLLVTDPALATQVTDVHLSNPWVWDLGPRLYAVCAITAQRV